MQQNQRNIQIQNAQPTPKRAGHCIQERSSKIMHESGHKVTMNGINATVTQHKMITNALYGQPVSGDKITRILAKASTELILNFKGEAETGLNFPISGDEIARIKHGRKVKDFITIKGRYAQGTDNKVLDEDTTHQCHFCGTWVDEGYEHDVDAFDADGNRKRHWLSDCRPDLVEHQPGELCTWHYANGKVSGCYAYQDHKTNNWTKEHTHFYKDGPM